MVGILNIKITLPSIRFDIKLQCTPQIVCHFISEVHESYLKAAMKLDSNIKAVKTRFI
jgi:hypothetical protein